MVAGMVTCAAANEPATACVEAFEFTVDTDMTMGSMEPEAAEPGQVDFREGDDPMGHKGSPGTVRGRDGDDA